MKAHPGAGARVSSDGGELEQRLLRGYQEQLRQYDRVAVLAPGWLPADDSWAHELNLVLKDVAALDAAMADDKEAWRRSERRPGSELGALLERLAEKLGTMAAGINRHVADIEARKDRLLPQIDELIQKRRMLRAYGQYGDRHSHARTRS
jgi:hypothetical protein